MELSLENIYRFIGRKLKRPTADVLCGTLPLAPLRSGETSYDETLSLAGAS
jgi:hypothetical protein